MEQYQPSFLISEGGIFPDMTLHNQHGQPVRTHAKGAGYRLYYFYPQDNTPTCTKEACNLRDHMELLADEGIQVFGISPDDEKSHLRFSNKHTLNFDLLVDSGHALASSLGIWGLKYTFGKEYEGLHRVSYLVDGRHRIISIIYPVESATHHAQVLDRFRAVTGGK